MIRGISLFAQVGSGGSSGPPTAEMFALGIGIALAIFAAVIAVLCILYYFIYRAAKQLPGEFRTIAPWTVWTLLIPCWGFIWAFFVFPRVSQGYKDYFAYVGDRRGDCGYVVGIAYCVTSIVSLFSRQLGDMGGLFGLVPLVLLIVYVVQIAPLGKYVDTEEARALKKYGDLDDQDVEF